MKSRACLLISVVSVCVAGCETIKGDFCTLAQPFYLTSKTVDAMTDEEVSTVLKHNETGERFCGWKPPLK